MKKYNIKCRYGIEYTIELSGSKGAIARTRELLSRCCCWICHNHDCQTPKNEPVRECGNVCEFYTRKPFCQRKEKDHEENKLE